MRTLQRTALLVSALALALVAIPAEARDHGGSRGHGGSHGHGSHGYSSRGSWGWGVGWGGWGPYGWGWWGGPGWGTVHVYHGTRPALGGRFAVIDTDVAPEEAELYLDGVYVGSADDFDGHPDFLYLAPGKYHLEFRHPGYETLKKDVDVSRGERLQIRQEMKLQPGHRRLEFNDPPPARGVPMGRVFGPGGKPVTAPGDRDEAADRDRDRVGRWDDDDEDRDPGRESVREEPAPPKVERVPEARRSQQARVRFQVTPEDAAVYVDDRYEGAGDELSGRRGILLEAGKRSVTVVRPGYQTKSVEVEAKVGQTVDVVVELTRQ